MNKYKTVFISHANPEDNEFASWLAAKLTMQGYRVWCDIEYFRVGMDLWQNIQEEINKNAIKFIFVISKYSISKQGTLKELSLAEKIYDRKNFIIPIKVDGTKSIDFPAEITRLFYINFSENWGLGLLNLNKYLVENEVPKIADPSSENGLEILRCAYRIKKSYPIEKNEQYLSNWLKIEIPKRISIFDWPVIRNIEELECYFPYIWDNERIITFCCSNCLTDIPGIRSFAAIDSKTFYDKRCIKLSNKYEVKDTNNKMINLLNQAMSDHLGSFGLDNYKLAGRRAIHYFPYKNFNKRVSLKNVGLSNTNLAGMHKAHEWSLALSFNAILYPFPAYFLSYHFVFTKDGELVDKAKQHKLRRSFGKQLYNKRLRNLMLGALEVISSGNEKFKMRVGCCNSIKVNKEPVIFAASKGYNEPDIKASKWN